MNVLNAKRCTIQCQKSLAEHEYDLRTVNGVENCSYADVETAILYAEAVQFHGTWRGQMISPSYKVREILDSFGLYD